jgi:hypothetical protein
MKSVRSVISYYLPSHTYRTKLTQIKNGTGARGARVQEVGKPLTTLTTLTSVASGCVVAIVYSRQLNRLPSECYVSGDV